MLPILFVCSAAAQEQNRPVKKTDIESVLIREVQKHPDDFQANHRLAEFYRAHDRLPAAIPFFEKAYELNPNDYSNAWDLALSYLSTRKLEQARRVVHALQSKNDRAELHNLLGSIEEAAGALRAAVTEYQRAAQMAPSEKNVFDYATVFSDGKAYAEARQIFQYGVEKYPKSARMRVGLAVALHGLGQYHEAVTALCEAVDLDPDDARPVYFLTSMRDISPEMSEHVTSRLAHLVEVHPNNAQVQYGYAVSLRNQTQAALDDRKLVLVERHLRRAVQLDPKLTDAHFQLGVVYEQRGELSDAIREFETAIQQDPGSPTYHYRLARAYAAGRMPEKSAEQLRIFRKLKESRER